MSDNCFLWTRREFLRNASVVAAATAMPAFLARAAAATQNPDGSVIPGFADDRILVVVQLAGGNDGLNTLVPFTDDTYFRLRPKLAIKKADTLTLNDEIGLHKSLKPLMDLAQKDKLTVVEGVGYPNPNRSHFRSTEIWQTASDSDRYTDTGWLGRYLDNSCGGEAEPVAGLAVGSERPQAFFGKRGFGVAVQDPDSFAWKEGHGAAREKNFTTLNAAGVPQNDTLDFLRKVTADAVLSSERVREVGSKYKGGVRYPGDSFAVGLQTVSRMISGGLPTRIYYVTLSGFDTHANQQASHANLLARFSNGISAFMKDMEIQGNSDRVLVMTFSEFGRRVNENASGGTDHGTAAPMFLLGNHINSGLAGKRPSLIDLDNSDLKFTTDFRSVYASVLEQWLGTPAEKVLGRKFGQIGLVKSAWDMRKQSLRNV